MAAYSRPLQISVPPGQQHQPQVSPTMSCTWMVHALNMVQEGHHFSITLPHHGISESWGYDRVILNSCLSYNHSISKTVCKKTKPKHRTCWVYEKNKQKMRKSTHHCRGGCLLRMLFQSWANYSTALLWEETIKLEHWPFFFQRGKLRPYFESPFFHVYHYFSIWRASGHSELRLTCSASSKGESNSILTQAWEALDLK